MATAPGPSHEESHLDLSGELPTVNAVVEIAAREAVIELNLGDLEELSNDIEDSTIYSLRPDTLAKWSSLLRTSIGTIRNNLHNGIDGKRKPLTQVPSSKSLKGETSHSSLRGMKRLNSVFDNLRKGVGDASAPPARSDASKPTTTANGALATVGASVAAAVHLLMEACAATIAADWGTCFIHNAKTDELVLASGVGRRVGRAGSHRVPASVGVESHVLATGIAVNVAHAYVEEEFSPALDKATNTRTKTQIVFPLMKPGTSSVAFGVMEFGNKLSGSAFTPDDENRVAQCSQLVSLIITKYPSDITNGNCFDPSVFPKDSDRERLPSITAGLNVPNISLSHVLVHRTARVGHLRRSEVMRDSVGLSSIPTITEAIGYVTKVNEAWRNAVILNMELEKEIDRLQEALRVSRRETTRLQGAVQDLKEQLTAQPNTQFQLPSPVADAKVSNAAQPSKPSGAALGVPLPPDRSPRSSKSQA